VIAPVRFARLDGRGRAIDHWPVRLCLFAFIGSDNLGDEAIFQTVYRDLQGLAPETLTVMSMDPERTRAIAAAPNARVVPAGFSRDTLSAIRHCDVLVCGGGGIFQDQTSIYNPSRYLARIQLAHAFSKQVFVYGVSVGPLRHALNRRAASEVLKRVQRLTVRDEASRRELISLGVPAGNVYTTSDPVLNFSLGAGLPPVTVTRKNVVVCLRHWFDTIDWLPVSMVNALHIRSPENTRHYAHFISNMAAVLDHVARDRETELTFVPFWGERDTRVHRDVVAKMTRRQQCRILAESPPPEQANTLIGAADFVIGMRLHSLIFAVANARPFFAIDYSKKVGDFLEEVLPGRVGLVSASPKDLDARATIEKLDRLERVHPFDDGYAASVAELKRKEKGNISHLRSLLENAS
jgi:polysaccharide pyruvyl transferase WcaK-like protein